jgi:hypothetical protein
VGTGFSKKVMPMETTPPVRYSNQDTINLENIDTYIVKNPQSSFHNVLIPQCMNGRITA